MTPFQIRRRIRSLFVSQDHADTDVPEAAANRQAPTEPGAAAKAKDDPASPIGAVETAESDETSEPERTNEAAVATEPVASLEPAAAAEPTASTEPTSSTDAGVPAPATVSEAPAAAHHPFRSAQIARGLQSSDWRVRLEAVETLSGLSDVNVTVPSLVERLRDPSVEVAVAAASGLGRQRATSAVSPLRDVLRNQDGFFGNVCRQASLAALCEILGEGALPDLRAAAGDLDADLAAAAIELLAEHGDSEDGQALRAIVDDRRGYYHPVVRQAAVSALGRLSK